MRSRRPVVTVAAAPAAFLELVDVKANLRVAWADEDAVIQGYLDAAVALFDGPKGRLGRAIMRQTWKHVCGGPEYGEAMLTAEPAEILTISYLDADEAPQVATLADYRVHTDGFYHWLIPATGKSWPTLADRSDALTITYTTGFADAADVPAPIKQAVQLLVGHWYKERETATAATLKEMPFAVEALLEDYKIGFAA